MLNVVNIEKLQDSLKQQLELRRRYKGHLRYDQNSWAYIDSGHVPENFKDLTEREVNICQTNCCLAGTAVTLKKDFLKFDFAENGQGSMYAHAFIDKSGARRSISNAAAEWLGLNPAQADVLFNSSDGWPEPYKERYEEAEAQENQEEKIQVAIDFLSDVLSSGGDVLNIEKDDDDYYGNEEEY